MTMRIARSAISALILVGLTHAAVAQGVGDFRRELGRIENTYAELGEHAREAIADRYDGVVHIKATALKLFWRADLSFELLFSGAEYIDGCAWSAWNESIHPIEASRLKLVGGPDNGRLEGEVGITLMPDGYVPADNKPMRIVLRVKGRFTDGKLRGTVQCAKRDPVRAERSDLTGTVRKLPADMAPGWAIDLQRRPADKLHVLGCYNRAVRYERRAVHCYHLIHALDIAKRRKISLIEAQRTLPLMIPARPAYKVEATSKPVSKAPELDDLELDDELGDEEADLGTKPRTSVKSDPARDRKFFRQIQAIHTHLQRTLAATAFHREAGPATVQVVRKSTAHGDPLFGPYYGSEPLPSTRDKPNMIGAPDPNAARQSWPYVKGWKVIGPIHGPLPPETPTLMPVIELDEGAYQLAELWSHRPLAEGEERSTGATEWREAEVPEYLHLTCLPGATTGRKPGYACGFTEVHSDEDVELRAAAGVSGDLRIWLNRRLYAVFEVEDRDHTEEIFFFKLRLKKGRNRIGVLTSNGRPMPRASDGRRPGHFWIRLCMAGRARAPEVAKAHGAKVAARMKNLRNMPANVRGYRNRGRSDYPDAEPVTAWDIEKRTNVRWHLPLIWSHAQPVVVGDKLYVLGEPHILYCLNKNTGEILWEKHSNLLELLDPALHEESKKLYAAFKTDWDNLVALGVDEEARIATLLRDSNDREKAVARLKALSIETEKKLNAWVRHIIDKGDCVMPSWSWFKAQMISGVYGGDYAFTGYSFPSPVTDGKRIWVQFATGVTACYDLAGKRQWMVRTPYDLEETAVCPSPLLLDGKLVYARDVDVTPPGRKIESKRDRTIETHITALDAATGERLWRAALPFRLSPWSLVAMRLTDGEEEMAVVLTREGGVVRVSDGKVLRRRIHGDCFGTPVGDVVHSIGYKATAAQLIMRDRDTLGVKHLWSSQFINTSYPLAYRDGYLYNLHGSQYNRGYRIFNAVTGKQVVRKVNVDTRANLTFRRGDCYQPTSIAGDYVFAAVRGARKRSPTFTLTHVRSKALQKRSERYTDVTVFQVGPQGRIVAHNEIDRSLTPSFVYDRDLLFIRGHFYVTCIGHTGEEGKAYEARVNAENILGDLAPAAPHAVAPIRVAPFRQTVPRRASLQSGLAIPVGQGVYLGPFNMLDKDDLLRKIGDGPIITDQDYTVGGITRKARGFSKEERGRLTAGRNHRPAFSMQRLLGDESDTVSLFEVTCTSAAKQVLRLINTGPGVEIRVSGKVVGHMARVRFDVGEYRVLVCVAVPGRATAAHDVSFRFEASDDPAAELEAWKAALRRNEPLLKRAIGLAPDSTAAQKARKLIEQL